jgi:DNA-binding protein YbaB
MLGTIYGTAMVNVGLNGKIDKEKVKMVHQMIAAGDGDCISPLLVADIEGCVLAFRDSGETLISDAIKRAD